MPELADRLQSEIEAAWPPRRERDTHAKIKVWRAFRESDKDQLRPSGWSKGMTDNDTRRDYIVDPLGERIPQVWADMLFGEDPHIVPVDAKDADRMAELIDANDLSSELQRAEWLCSSEGEVWWRVVPNDSVGHAMIEFHSRLVVVPLWSGRTLQACAFASELERDDKKVIRYVEIHEAGYVRRMLYEGAPTSEFIGTEVPLTNRPETAEWESEWVHGLDILAGRIVNKYGADTKAGVSDYDGLEDLMLALNETTTIGQENARLTAKQRAILPQRFLDTQGNFPRGAEILVSTEVDQDPDKVKNQVAMIEFEFDAAALIAYIEHQTDVILTRARVAPQLVGRHTEGAQTGPALKARVIDSVLAAQGKGKFWDDAAPKVILSAIQVENMSTSQGGLGLPWGNSEDFPTFRRSSSLPEDEEATARRLSIEVTNEMLSRKTAIAMSHPEWDERRVQEEVDQIMLEVGNNAPAPDDPMGGQPELDKNGNPVMGRQTPEFKNQQQRVTDVARRAQTVPATGDEKEERRDGPNGKR